MSDTQETHSEVTRLLKEISQEYEAAQQGLTGLSLGSSQHKFMNARMERVAVLHSQLQILTGSESMALMDAHLEQSLPERQMKH